MVAFLLEPSKSLNEWFQCANIRSLLVFRLCIRERVAVARAEARPHLGIHRWKGN